MPPDSAWDPRTRPRLLIADDDPMIRSSLSMGLGSEFEIVAMVADGESAVEQARRTRPEAAVIDVQMPGGGGPHAVRGIAAASPETAIVVLSADESDGLVRDLLEAGAMTYLRKGLSPLELSKGIAASIRAHRGARDAPDAPGAA